MDTDDLTRPPAAIGRECANCATRLATDQRYCINCGTRRGPLPSTVDATLRHMRDVAPLRIIERRPPPEPVLEQRPPLSLTLPTPRVAALAVMAMLSFGVVAGSLTGPGGVESLARSIVVSLPLSPPAPPPAIAAASDAGGSSGGASQQAITETITERAPSSPPAATTPPANITPTDTGTGSGPGTGSAAVSLPPIKHVFLIMLSSQGYTQSFAMAKDDPYLSTTLRKQGELITDYYGVAPSSLSNEIALISGQGPTQDTAANCPVVTDILPTDNRSKAQVIGNGCVYPATTQTLPSELTDNGNTWRAYIQGVDQGPAGQPRACRYPAAGATDPNHAATATDPYVTYLNPFVYFAGLTSGQCAHADVGIDKLTADLKQAKDTPNLAYIAPDACHDGSDTPCTPGAPAGLAQSDAFLKSVVPKIEASPAYKQDGLIVITFDQAPQSGPNADTSSCCDQPSFPNLSGAADTTTTATTTTETTPTDTMSTGTTAPAPTTTETSTTAAATTTTMTTSGTASCPTSTTGTATTPTTPTTPTTTQTTPTQTTTTTSTIPAATTTPAETTTTTGATSTTTATTTTGTCSGTPAGGGQVGALMISRYVKAGSQDASDTFNHFSLLKTVEDLFSVPMLGYAKDASLPEFDTAVFNNYTSG